MLTEELRDLKIVCEKNGAIGFYNRVLAMLREKHPLEGIAIVDDLEKEYNDHIEQLNKELFKEDPTPSRETVADAIAPDYHSDCCGAKISNTDYDICPQCQEHCEIVDHNAEVEQ